MRRALSLQEFREHMNGLQQALMLERDSILNTTPREAISDREKYAFAYVRAERFGVKAVNQRLNALSWLPLYLDPEPEMMGRERASMKRWIKSGSFFEPSSVDFGNDLMHALTRAALREGWNSPPFLHVASRIARLFQDFSCLVNIAYFTNWLVANNVDKVALTLSGDLLQTAMEVTAMMREPGLFVLSYKDLPSDRPAEPHDAHKAHSHLHVVQRNEDPGPSKTPH